MQPTIYGADIPHGFANGGLHPTLLFVARTNRMDERHFCCFLSELENAMNYGRIPIPLLEILVSGIIHCIYTSRGQQ